MHAAAKKEAFSSAEKVADEMLRRHGRSFYWARHLLGRETARRSTLLYSFCRFIDDIADGDLPGGVDLLRTIRSQVETGDQGEASGCIVHSYLKHGFSCISAAITCKSSSTTSLQ